MSSFLVADGAEMFYNGYFYSIIICIYLLYQLHFTKQFIEIIISFKHCSEKVAVNQNSVKK